MQNDIHLKTIISVSVLVLVIGFIDTAQMKSRAVTAGSLASTTASTDRHAIDSSFFNSSAPSDHPSAARHSSSVPDSQSLSSRKAQNPVQPDIITADSYLVGNLATGRIYLEKSPAVVRPIASISKLVTALVIDENMDPDRQIGISSSSVTGYEQTDDIHPGETFSAHDLLTGMLLISSNDAALAFANNFGYTAFISLMNSTARSLGMSQTSFKDPSGLSPNNVSSANDLFKLARYLYSDDPGILAITKMPQFDVATTTLHDGHDFVNIDPFAYDPHYIGGKTGRSDQAGETMLSMFNLPISGVDNPIAIVVLHSNQDDRQIDSSILVGKVLGLISSQ